MLGFKQENKGSEEILSEIAIKNPEVMLGKKMDIPKVPFEEYVDILCCPACFSDIEIEEDRPALKCTNTNKCGFVYQIIDGIPRMIVEDAVAEKV